MNWMWIATGMIAAGMAVGLLWMCGRKGRKESKGEVSMLATVKRVIYRNGETFVGVFAAQGKELQFAIPGEIARQLHEGERGVLTYRGSEFVYFVPREHLFETEEENQWRTTY